MTNSIKLTVAPLGIIAGAKIVTSRLFSSASDAGRDDRRRYGGG